MSALKGKKIVGAGFGNEVEVVRVTYDYSLDGGATGALDVLEADSNIAILNFYVVGKTTCTSGGSATLDVGVSGGDTDILLDGAAVASLTANALVQSTELVLAEGTPNTYVAAMPLKLSSGGKIVQEIKVAAFTAGKLEYVFHICKL